MTYRALGKQLGISAPTAQRRVESLFSRGRIRSIRYRFDLDTVGGKWVLFLGQAKVKLTPKVIDGLQDHGSINRVYQGAFNYIICWVDLREQSDIEGVTDFMMSRLELVDLQVLFPPSRKSSGGLVSYRKELIQSPPPGDLHSLTRTDLKIIRQLSIDGRKPINSIANETGISPRTLKRRIDFLVKNRFIEPEVDMYQGTSDDIWFGMMVRLNNPSAKDDLFKQLAKYEGHLYTSGWDYSNELDVITFDGMFQSMSEVHELVSTITQIEGVVETKHTVYQMSNIFDTWVHRMSQGELPLPRSRASK